MERGEPKAETQLEHEAASLLSRWDQGAIEQIDALLTDAAAAALRLSITRLRIDRELDATVSPGAPSSSWRMGLWERELFLERKGLAAKRDRIEKLTRHLRLHRDRLSPLRARRI
jgi:hypothetical protein